MSAKIMCDNCAADLTETSSMGWRLHVEQTRIPSAPGPTFDVWVPKELPNDGYDFCSLNCLTSKMQKLKS